MVSSLRFLSRPFAVAALALLLGGGASFAPPPLTAAAHAPAIGVAEFDQPLLAAPDPASEVLLALAAGQEVQLTGAASGPYVEVTAGGVVGWVDVNLIHAGQVITAVTNQVTSLTAAPADDAALIAVIPAGETVILTGAAVDAWLAGAYEGSGGWLPAADLSR